MSGSEHLIQMANDIGNFFRANPNREEAVTGIANHIMSFWTRRMREKLQQQITEQGDMTLDELPREAVRRLANDPGPKQQPAAKRGDAG